MALFFGTTRTGIQRDSKRHRSWARCTALALTLALPFPGLAESAPGYSGIGVFELPAIARAEEAILTRARLGSAEESAAQLSGLIARYPDAWRLRLLAAGLAVARGDKDGAVTALLEADRLEAPGLREILSGDEFAEIAADPRLAAIGGHPAQQPAPPEPGLISGGQARVTPGNSTWDPERRRIVTRFAFPPILRTHSFAQNPPPGPLQELQQLVRRGQAAGNTGDLYDNRDGGHSALPQGAREQLSHVVYGPQAEAAGLHYGLNTALLFDAPTFGNSSTALTGQLWRSQPRHALTTPGGPQSLWELYTNNHIYVFPEHTDHDPVAGGGQGDVFPALTPYMLISQGSSGSDQPILEAIKTILAAFPPDVKERLRHERLIAPAVQKVFRSGLTGLGPEGILDPLAHPSVFLAESIDLAAMIRTAQQMRPETLPGLTRIRVLRESPPHASVFAERLSERLFDTPAAVARVWRGGQFTRSFVLGAAETVDPNGRDLTFHWRVLRGDPDRIRTKPLDEAGTRVEVEIDWQEPAPVPGRAEITSSRVDIAVFADNGAEISAPAYFSLLFPAHERRTYDAMGRPLRIDRRRDGADAYADPLIWPVQDWEDRFDHAADGTLLGWVRTDDQGTRQYTPHGLEVLETGEDGRPAIARQVGYRVEPVPGHGTRVVIVPGETRYRLRYEGPADRTGRPAPLAE